MPQEQVVAYPRIGNLQAEVVQSDAQELRFAIRKLVPPEVLQVLPEAGSSYTLAEIALLKELCNVILQMAAKMHTTIAPKSTIRCPDVHEPLPQDTVEAIRAYLEYRSMDKGEKE